MKKKALEYSTPQNVDVASNTRVDLIDLAIILCEDEVHLIKENSPVRKGFRCNQVQVLLYMA